MEEMHRSAIIVAVRAGRTPAEIIDFLRLPKSTVYDVVKRYRSENHEDEDSGMSKRKKHDRDPRTRTRATVDQVQLIIEADPRRSIRSIANQLSISERTCRRIVYEDLRYQSYCLKVRQYLSDAAKAKRLERALCLIASLKHSSAGRIRFFSDEKIFTVDEVINRRNDRYLARDPEDVPVVGKTKFPASVHVLSVVSSDGDVMPPHIFAKGETVTKEVYLKVLQETVKPWIDNVSDGRPYVFQQDGAPAHTSNIVQNWLDAHMDSFWAKNVWPPNSPDLNPLDYFVWGVIERETNKSRHDGVASLKTAIQAAFAEMNREHLVAACSRFRSRVEAVIAAGGSYIE